MCLLHGWARSDRQHPNCHVLPNTWTLKIPEQQSNRFHRLRSKQNYLESARFLNRQHRKTHHIQLNDRRHELHGPRRMGICAGLCAFSRKPVSISLAAQKTGKHPIVPTIPTVAVVPTAPTVARNLYFPSASHSQSKKRPAKTKKTTKKWSIQRSRRQKIIIRPVLTVQKAPDDACQTQKRKASHDDYCFHNLFFC